MAPEPPHPSPGRKKLRQAVQIVASTGLWVAALFGGAGSFGWLRGWIYFAAYLGLMIGGGIVVHRVNPGLFEARSRWRRRDTKPFDKVFLAVFLPLAYIQPFIGGLDNVRYHWWPIPFVAIYPGLLLFILAVALICWTMAVNPFAESTVRIQTDRGHSVVTAGPYRFVRHPMYVGAILMYLATPLLLGSMWAFMLSLLVILLFVVRTALEDRTLHHELPGYPAYAAATRYRLLPGLW